MRTDIGPDASIALSDAIGVAAREIYALEQTKHIEVSTDRRDAMVVARERWNDAAAVSDNQRNHYRGLIAPHLSQVRADQGDA